jgi:hypothetical protein
MYTISVSVRRVRGRRSALPTNAPVRARFVGTTKKAEARTAGQPYAVSGTRTERAHRTSPGECRQTRPIGTYALALLSGTERRLGRATACYRPVVMGPPATRTAPDGVARSRRSGGHPFATRGVW